MRRPASLILDLSLVVLGALLGIVSSFAVAKLKELSWLATWAQVWALPGLGCLLAAVLVLRIWIYRLDQKEPIRRWTSSRPPFPGLDAFADEDAAVFFGRSHEIDQLLVRLHPVASDKISRLIPIIGPSGAGKSSLVQAGLLPRLAVRRQRWFVVPTLVPGTYPIANLTQVLADQLRRRPPNRAICRSMKGRARHPNGESSWSPLELLKKVRAGRIGRILLVIDQAEEILTLAAPSERDEFLTILDSAMRADNKLWVIMTLRSEFFTHFLTTHWSHLFTQPVVVGPLNRDKLLNVIQGPAEEAGIRFDPQDLPWRMVIDTGNGDALPLLAYTLQTLYHFADKNGVITASSYDALGGVSGTLSQRADIVSDDLRKQESSSPVVQTLLRFVTLNDNRPTKRPVFKSALSDAERKVVDAFLAARILTSDTTPDSNMQTVLNVAHEALFEHWPPLQHAIATHAEDLQWLADLERWALDWERSGRRPTYLLQGDRLASSLQHSLKFPKLGGHQLTVDFLEQSQKADQNTVRRLADTVAHRALDTIEDDPERALMLALAAVDEYTITPLVGRALATALVRNRTTVVLNGHIRELEDVAWSPDGLRVATAAFDRTIKIWDVRTGQVELTLSGHNDRVWGVAWSPDGNLLASGSRDRTACVWDTYTGAALVSLDGHQGGIWGISWCPVGPFIATGSYDGTARVWDVRNGFVVASMNGHNRDVCGVAWSNDGKFIATGSRDQTAKVWDAATGSEVLTLRGHRDGVWNVDWSPDGQFIATVSDDRTARVWSASTGEQLVVIRGHQDRIWGVSWSPDGRRLATGSRDKTARVWDSISGTELLTLRGHKDGVASVKWAPSGQWLCTGSLDRTARVWDAREESIVALSGHRREVVAAVWSPDGQRIATGSDDRTARIWDSNAGLEMIRMSGHKDAVWSVAWSPDGSTLATASLDRTARLWNAANGAERMVLRDHDDWVLAVAWAPSGELLATSSADWMVRIWNPKTGENISTIKGHKDRVRIVAWSPDGRRIATGDDLGFVHIWNVDNGERVASISDHKYAVWALAWSPDGGRIASASRGGAVTIWDVQRRIMECVLLGHGDTVWGMAWSPDSAKLATASSDRTVRIWDVNAESEVAIAGVHAAPVSDVSWSPDGHRLVTASQDGTARIWDATVTMDSIIAMARHRIRNSLTEAERGTLLGD
ncbi:MAG TPA: AAA family ATPase [Actinophytocola sp.]|uniref:nSTAND1 domain-containing NTPase n=1 Tax=Actinophytocola sp. TaxID=1872138 RepID=UPI002DB9D644|nr:AAA family ATPase [Actinophytocola sp.]HEU5470904.1 AAA family ATPase [Actinophytocola sp.]